jgi:hypothetical protein
VNFAAVSISKTAFFCEKEINYDRNFPKKLYYIFTGNVKKIGLLKITLRAILNNRRFYYDNSNHAESQAGT